MCLIYGTVSTLGLLQNLKDEESCQHQYAVNFFFISIISSKKTKSVLKIGVELFFLFGGPNRSKFFLSWGQFFLLGFLNNPHGNFSIVSAHLLETHMCGLVVKHSCLQNHSCFLFPKLLDKTQKCINSTESPLASYVETMIYFCNKRACSYMNESRNRVGVDIGADFFLKKNRRCQQEKCIILVIFQMAPLFNLVSFWYNCRASTQGKFCTSALR